VTQQPQTLLHYGDDDADAEADHRVHPQESRAFEHDAGVGDSGVADRQGERGAGRVLGEDGGEPDAVRPRVLRAPPKSRPPVAGGSVPLARLGGIEVRAAVELGAAELRLRDIAALGPGSVVELDRLVGDPVDLTVNGRVFACGDIVVVGDRLGLRLTRLAASPAGD
jgi:flagellar motor switch protein FliN/FliY